MIFRLLHILIATFILVNSTGILVRQHYCENILQKTRLFVKPESCHKAKKHQHRHACCKIMAQKMATSDESDCCDDQSTYLKQKLDYTSSEVIEELSSFMMLLIDFSFLNNTKIFIDELSMSFVRYRPPPLIERIFILVQSFLL